MIEIILAAGTGLVAGLIHVVSGPDHMAAVLPFAVDAPKRAVRLGLLWGVGHGMGVIALGVAFWLISHAAPVERISEVSEMLVGVLLVALGFWALRRSRLVVVHHHDHDHATEGHAHPHVHFNDPTVDEASHRSEGRHHAHHHSTMGFGFIHGVAGAGHVIVAGPLVALSGPAAVAYLASYLVGGMGAMTVFALCAGALVRRPAWIPTALQVAGVASVTVGVAWMSSFAYA